jgi:hypothetical protein
MRYGVVLCDTVLCDAVWRGAMRYSALRRSALQCGALRCFMRFACFDVVRDALLCFESLYIALWRIPGENRAGARCDEDLAALHVVDLHLLRVVKQHQRRVLAFLHVKVVSSDFAGVADARLWLVHLVLEHQELHHVEPPFFLGLEALPVGSRERHRSELWLDEFEHQTFLHTATK